MCLAQLLCILVVLVITQLESFVKTHSTYYTPKKQISLYVVLKIKRHICGDSLAVQWLGLCAFTAKGTDSIPGQGTMILQAI